MLLEHDSNVLDQKSFPGPQGRLAFAYLVLERQRPVPRGELVELLWPRKRPTSFSTSLTAIISKLRALLDRSGIASGLALSGASGYYQLQLPSDVWVDIDAAFAAVHEAEAALRAGDHRGAFGPSGVAYHIAERPFLSDLEGEWVERWRTRLRDLHVRALECEIEVSLGNQEAALALQLATRLVELEPFRETGHQGLMRAHAAAGNRAAALLGYERCRKLLAKELAIGPSPATRAVYREIRDGGSLRAVQE
jgi:SARP family transcriptional regulator, regulator of embCAB operon